MMKKYLENRLAVLEGGEAQQAVEAAILANEIPLTFRAADDDAAIAAALAGGLLDRWLDQAAGIHQLLQSYEPLLARLAAPLPAVPASAPVYAEVAT